MSHLLTIICRAESSHAQLKRQLGSSQGNFEAVWTKIHNLLELQHTGIKASFEKSKTIVQHNFKPVEYKELRGNVSKNALEKILTETKRANLVGIDAGVCGCVIRRTHGLPCAHEIAEYISQGRPIPLSCIHPHWCKLDMLPTAPSTSSCMSLDCKADLQLLEKRFNEYDSTRKLQLLKKIRELSKPESTHLIEPEVKSRTRGRPSMKVDTSTRRDPSAFELVSSAQDSYSPKSAAMTEVTDKGRLECKPKRREKISAIRTRSRSINNYVLSFPLGLRPYI